MAHGTAVSYARSGGIGAKKDGAREGRKHQNNEFDRFLSSLVPYTS